MVFYSLFVIAILNLRAGMIVFSIWFIAIVFCIFQVGPIEPRPQTFLQILSSRLDLYFFLGVLVAFALRRGFIRPIAVASAAAAIPLYWVGGAIADTFFQMMVCTALVCLCIQLSSVAASPKVFLWMAAISYPLYLINETAGGFRRPAILLAIKNAERSGVIVRGRKRDRIRIRQGPDDAAPSGNIQAARLASQR